ncbi:MAG: glycosyltransferase [Candidatus Aegiribacteria sp.]|nr:glycosyltransferase [Candidatus Aegiribacteria sp.]
MRILVTVNCMGVDASADGGLALARMLMETAHEVLLQAPPGTDVISAASEMGLPVAGLDLRKGAIVSGLFPFRRIVKKFSPEAIVATRADGQTAAATVASGVPLVRVRCDIRKPAGGKLWRFVDRRTDLVVFPSMFMVRRGYRGERNGPVAVVPHPVDTELFRPADEGGKDSPPLLISIGRLSPMKGHRTLIKALSLLEEDFKAVIAGPPSQQSMGEIANFASECGVGKRIETAGRVEDVAGLARRATLGIVTSLGSEVVSRAGMEIMSSGLPLLASATNGLLDLLQDGTCGFFHSPGNHEQLARQIRFLMRNPSLSKRLGKSGRKICLDEYSFASVAKEWNGVLDDIAKGNKFSSEKYYC